MDYAKGSYTVQDQVIRWPAVKAMTGLSRSTIWRLESTNAFPPRRQISNNCVGWLEAEVLTWMKSRPVTHRAGSRAPQPS